ncbi:uncharacterized protein E0L32_011194 [Thyridium curvatum]|uniref:Arylsulfatase n=1 Tax=Thyridium curvatum TaxID=1093900 RepID=A0A507BP71_9PEZI|nr:uncharacterized protein E0L32_011194 [Thyridium curvatum]TPX19121.1 hypothetical protein E0L32_011194 [Thyridium curvatum]
MAEAKRPNFLMVVADDLGFSDTSPYGSEISTPALQKLSDEGIRLTNFHTAPACSPTRSMLLSGTDHHIAGLGQLAEMMERSKDPSVFEGRPGYEGYLNFRVAALPEILRDAGYLNIMSGKWHLGMKQEHSPSARGFDKVFSFLAGSGNHYNWEPQFDSDKYKFQLPGKNKLWMDGDRYMDRKTEIPENFYSTSYTTERMLGFLKGRTEEEKKQPFFGYLCYLAPHWPLQAPKETRDKYLGKYADGPSKLSERRIKKLIELGLVPADVVPAKPEGTLEAEWDELSDEERALSARKMETYAAMVELIDEGVGQVVDYLESTGELDNTFVCFISDNGAEGVNMEALPVMGGESTMARIIEEFYDNSLDNIGNRDSFVYYGPRWACAATAPSRGFKCRPTEGGIRCPCIVRYPPFGNAPAAISHKFTTVMDLLPTFLELAGVPLPGATFHEREVVPVRGKSWRAHLASKDYESTEVHDENYHVHGWELVNLRAIRRGNWKAVWMHPPRGTGEWELFDLSKDPAESKDLSQEQPELMKEMLEHWERYYAETGMFDIPFEFARLVVRRSVAAEPHAAQSRSRHAETTAEVQRRRDFPDLRLFRSAFWREYASPLLGVMLTDPGDTSFQLLHSCRRTGTNSALLADAWDDWGPAQDRASVQVINNVLDKESPGLVVLNGDLITGENTFLENSTTYVDQIVGPLVARDLTWASTYGNHDRDVNITAQGIFEREHSYPNSRTRSMVQDSAVDVGVSNYYLPVFDSSCRSCHCTPELLLWFFDSRGGHAFQHGSTPIPDWVDERVVKWFRETNAELVARHNKTIPSLAFFHIPVYASLAAQNVGIDKNRQPGINDDVPLAPQAQGWCPDGTSNSNCRYGGQDVPFMQALADTDGLLATFSGHDHGDTWCYKWDGGLPGVQVKGTGKNLCFGQHSGYGGYGNWERGARQVLVTKDGLSHGLVDTWIRLESGNVVGNVVLNSTYGQDLYPATPNTKTKCPGC